MTGGKKTTKHTTIEIALYIHTPTDTHFKLAMPETLPHLHFTTKQKSLFLFQHTLRVIVCVCVGVCI